MKAGDSCRIRQGKFAGLYCRLVESKTKTQQFATIWADRIQSTVHVSIPIELEQRGEILETRIRAVLPACMLVVENPPKKLRQRFNTAKFGELFGLECISIPKLPKREVKPSEQRLSMEQLCKRLKAILTVG